MNHVSNAKSQQAISEQNEICTNYRHLHRQSFKNAKMILQNIERLEKKIHTFYQEDLNRFQEWEQSQFKDQTARLAALQDHCYVLTHFHNRILATSRLLKVSIPRAYQILKSEEEALETGSDLTRAMVTQAWAERDQFIQAEMIRNSEAAMENQNQKRERKQKKEKASPSISSSSFLMGVPPWELMEEEIKLTYRKLVRQLHPDFFTSRTSPKGEWMLQYWHRAQDAYQAKDQSALRKLYVMTVIRLQDLSSLSLSEIKEMTHWFQNELESLQAKVQVFKSSRAWGFSGRKNYQSLATQITKEFSRQMTPLSRQIQFLTIYHEMLKGGRQPLEAWQKLAASQGRSRKRRTAVHAAQTSFLEFLSEPATSSEISTF